MDIHQSKPLRVNLKETVELETLTKIDKIRAFLTRSSIYQRIDGDTSDVQ